MSRIKKLYVVALAAHGDGLSGGDRIFIELTRRWSKKFPIDIFVWEEGKKMLERQNLSEKNINIHVIKLGKFCKIGFLVCYIFRIIKGIQIGLTLKVDNDKHIYLYNASEFWMDSFTCAILKWRYSKINWIASWYQTAPNPFIGFNEGTRENVHRFKAFLYWLVQSPVKVLINKYASKVIVNNESERIRFPRFKAKDILVMLGAVRLSEIEQFIRRKGGVAKKYEGVFQGRFHAQKGVVELIDIWTIVVKTIPAAKLIMIGDGPLMGDVKKRIIKRGLEKNIILLGYVFDGEKKYSTFAASRIVLHPAFYDSGGMATAEAMAFGLPAVGFDLVAYRSYYPKGMLKVEVGSIEKFANAIINLLNDENKFNIMSKEAKNMIKNSWSWDYRANEILNQI